MASAADRVEPTAFEKRVARRLKDAFEASGMKLFEFAARAGVKPGTAHGWLHGRNGIRMGNLRKAANILGVKLTELVA